MMSVSLRPSGQNETLTSCEKGLKLRDIRRDTEISFSDDNRLLWSTMRHPSPSHLVNLGRSVAAPAGVNGWLLMRHFDCNAPGTSGYSVATDGNDIIHVHVHGTKNSTGCGFYKEVASSFGKLLRWIYMPIDEGEYVAEILRHYIPSGKKRECLGIMVSGLTPPVMPSEGI